MLSRSYDSLLRKWLGNSNPVETENATLASPTGWRGGKLRRRRSAMPGHYARPDVFRLMVNDKAQPAAQTNVPAVFEFGDQD